MDFTEVKACQGYKYLLVMVCTFTGWVEVYPTKIEKAKEVARFLLRHSILRFGFPLSIESDSRPAFVGELLQLVCKAVNSKWKLHAAYRPQSSGRVERMTRTIKVTLAKWLQETGAPLAGRAAVSANEDQNDPWSHGYSPYEMMFGRPSPLIREVKGNLLPRGGMRRHCN